MFASYISVLKGNSSDIKVHMGSSRSVALMENMYADCSPFTGLAHHISVGFKALVKQPQVLLSQNDHCRCQP